MYGENTRKFFKAYVMLEKHLKKQGIGIRLNMMLDIIPVPRSVFEEE